MFKNSARIVTALLLLVAFTGCKNETITESTTGPQTFSEAAEQLVTMKNKIRDGFASGDIDSAHDPLHQVGNLLENLAKLAKKSDLTTEQMDAVEQAKETLFDAFGEMDKTFHGGEGATYEEKADAIQEAMQVIVGAAGVTDDSKAPNQTSADDGLPAGEAGTVDAAAGSGTSDGQ